MGIDSKATECRARAADQRERALHTALPRKKESHIRAAEVWDQMADKADTFDAHVLRNLRPR